MFDKIAAIVRPQLPGLTVDVLNRLGGVVVRLPPGHGENDDGLDIIAGGYDDPEAGEGAILVGRWDDEAQTYAEYHAFTAEDAAEAIVETARRRVLRITAKYRALTDRLEAVSGWVQAADANVHKCASPHCPGLPWKASDQPHPCAPDRLHTARAIVRMLPGTPPVAEALKRLHQAWGVDKVEPGVSVRLAMAATPATLPLTLAAIRACHPLEVFPDDDLAQCLNGAHLAAAKAA